MPRRHVETVAALPASEYDAFVALLRSVEPIVARLGFPLLFEHGARCPADGGCGIYHAHVHLVPVPAHVATSACFDNPRLYDSLNLAYASLRSANDYLLVRDTHGQIAALEGLSSSMHGPLPSQFMRRQLVDLFGLDRPWDWREYREPEPAVIETLELFGVAG
jgi:hypothetical protein